MLFAAHSISAGVLGEALGNPVLAFFVGCILHLLLDTIPHFDTTDDGEFTPRQWAVVLVDLAIGLILLIFVMRIEVSLRSPFIWGIIGGNVPDLLDNVPFWRNHFRNTRPGKRFHRFHEWLQYKGASIFWGILTQVFIILISIFVYSSLV